MKQLAANRKVFKDYCLICDWATSLGYHSNFILSYLAWDKQANCGPMYYNYCNNSIDFYSIDEFQTLKDGEIRIQMDKEMTLDKEMTSKKVMDFLTKQRTVYKNMLFKLKEKEMLKDFEDVRA
jgi:hypothetical protein